MSGQQEDDLMKIAFLIAMLPLGACTFSGQGQVDANLDCTTSCEDDQQNCYADCDTSCTNASDDGDSACDTDCHKVCDDDYDSCSLSCSSD
jgi:hypothetical protein